jgi:hypothetical protein
LSKNRIAKLVLSGKNKTVAGLDDIKQIKTQIKTGMNKSNKIK